ncbi:MAG: hypothetical protein CL920_14045 [Deltaproteobacteria bacterium]|nr:hypothetical protein [Deltaproteobacteria bacterium]MBU49810.1 hypothetical protein [Deltaproteobacteria bacterium]
MLRLFIQFFTKQPELYNDYRWVWAGPWSQWSLILLAVLLTVALFFSWHAARRLPKLSQKLMLVGLRTLLAGLLWFLIAGPALELRHVQKIQNHLPIFIDTSASLRTQNTKNGPTRMEKIKQFFARNKAFIERLKQEQKVRFYTFDRDVKVLGKAIKSLQPEGDQTDLLKIGHLLQEKYHDRPLAGVIIVTDGNDTLAFAEGRSSVTKKDTVKKRKEQANRRMRYLLQMLKRLQIPVHMIVPPVRKGLRDIAVAEIFGDAFAFLHNTATVEAKIVVQGYTSMRLPVSLYREGQLLKSTFISLKPGQREYTVSFKFKPRKAGKFIYSVRVPVLRGEAVTENNRKDFILKIIRDRIRVLQVVGRPSWDVRFMRRLLKKNANIDLISFFIMRTHHNVQRVPLQDIALIPFPAKELFTKAIFSFDLIIFQNFNYAPYLRRQYLDNITRFIQKGGAFVMVGGELSFGAGGYLGTSLEQALPVRLGLGHIDTRPFSPQLSKAGIHHPITRLLPNLLQSQQVWKSLPKVTGSNIIGPAKPNSTVLLEHPFLQTDTGKPLPVLTIGEHKKGRVMSLTVDESWRWNFSHVGQGGTKAPYYRFWNNAIRWLIRDPELERVQVTTFRSSYRQGEKARFRIRVLDRNYQPKKKGDVRISIQKASETGFLHQSTEKLQSNGTVSFSWLPSKPGMYRIRVESKLSEKVTATGSELFQVHGLHDEFQRIQPNVSLFRSVKKATKGRTIGLDETLSELALRPATIVRVDRSQTVDLWDNIIVLLLLLLLLTTEWTLRRRWGLL